MLGIGEYAGLTGLSVKALRHYDDKGVLRPAEVEEPSGYRRYSEAQVRDGVIVRALRDAGVSLPSVAAALADGSALQTLAERRREVLEEREREDRAHAAAERALRALHVPVEVVDRELEAQPYVGRVISVPLVEAEELTDDDASALFAELFEQVQRDGLGPSGQFWTSIRPGERGQVDLVCCWPTVREAEPGWGGPGTEIGMLPKRTDLVARWRPQEGEELPEGYTHPAVVALFEELARRGADVRDAEVRQTVIGESADDWTVEVAITERVR